MSDSAFTALTESWPQFLSSRFTPIGQSQLGGMGQVQRASCLLYQRDVAVKRHLVDLGIDDSVLTHEHAVLSELSFPGVVHVWERIRVGGESFLVTEWVDGQRLDAFLDSDPQPDHISLVLYQLLVTLSWVHNQQVVHGDIKPANILVVRDETGPRPILIDFGVAFVAKSTAASNPTGGTKTFTAPELWSGQQRHPTPLSDLYALGLSFLHGSRRALPEPVRTLCTAMSEFHPMRRPSSAAAALARFQFRPHSDTKLPFPTGRSLAPLWSPWLEQRVVSCGQPGARLWFAGPTVECAVVLARRLAALIELSVVSADLLDVRVIPAPQHPNPLRFFRDLATWWAALSSNASVNNPVGASNAAIDGPDSPHDKENSEFPELWRASVDQIVERLVVSLKDSSKSPVLIVPGLADRSMAELTVLHQLIVAVKNLSVVVIYDQPPGIETMQWIPTSVSERFDVHPVPVPDRETITAYVRHYGRGTVSERALDILSERAPAGALAIRTTMDLWLANGALLPRLDGSLRCVDEKLSVTDQNETAVSLWHSLWTSLPPSEKDIIRALVGLGGTGDTHEVLSILPFDFVVTDRLAMSGWIDVFTTGSHLQLNPVVLERLSSWDNAPIPLTLRRQWVSLLRNRPSLSAREWLCLASHLEALADDGFLTALGHASRHYLAEGQPRLAGELALRRAKMMGTVDPVSAHKEVLWAARSCIAASANDLAQEAIELALVWAQDDPVRLSETHLGAAAAALHVGNTDAVIAHIAGFRATPVDPHPDPPDRPVRFAAEAALLVGSALALSGRLDVAEKELLDAKTLGVQGFGLPQSVPGNHNSVSAHLFWGKLENNLGNLEYQRAHWQDAAAAYRRSLDRKRAVGDRRGERIATSNLALTLRQSENFDGAVRAALSAFHMAKVLGDLRGQAMGHLIFLAMATDTAALELADTQLRALDDFGTASAFVRLDADLCRIRLCMLDGRFATAAEVASATFTRAQADGAELVAREAWGLLQAARIFNGDLPEWNETTPSSEFMPPVPTSTEGLSVADYLTLAVVACRYAVKGQWDLARALLAPHPQVPVGGEPGLRLFCEAADIVGFGPQFRSIAAKWRRDRSTQCLKLRSVEVFGTRWICHPARFRVWTGADGQLSSPLGGIAGSVVKELPSLPKVPHDSTTATPEFVEQPLSPISEMPLAPSATDGMVVPQTSTLPDNPVGQSQPAAAAVSDTSPDVPDSIEHPNFAPYAVPNTQITLNEWLDRLRTQHHASSASLWSLRTDPPLCTMTAGALDVCPSGVILGELRHTDTDAPWSALADGQIEQLLFPLRWNETLTAILAMRWETPHPVNPSHLTTLISQLAPTLALFCQAAALDAENIRFQVLLQKIETDAQLQRESFLAEVSELRDALHRSRLESELRSVWPTVIRRSGAMQKTLQTLDRVARSELPVLLLGESGVGKELLARVLHDNSEVSAGPFISENCGAIPVELFESIFFGVARGAYTGATENKAGLVELADGGSLFLDEIGDLRPDHQVKLLRIIQEHRFRRVGGQAELTTRFRLICATNRDLGAEVAAGRFREDLYFRIAVVPVTVPPLRDRPEDIAPLVAHFLDRQVAATGKRWTLSHDALSLLEQYPWPGNVRELENEILRATVLAEGDRIEARHFSDKLTVAKASVPMPPSADSQSKPPLWDGVSTLQDHVDATERAILIETLHQTGGQKVKTAELLGLSRPGLDAKLERFGLGHLPREIKSRRL